MTSPHALAALFFAMAGICFVAFALFPALVGDRAPEFASLMLGVAFVLLSTALAATTRRDGPRPWDR